jgi:hypothetical protein
VNCIIRTREKCQERPIRAMVEIVEGELKFYPIADSDEDERRILDALRFFREDFSER